MQITIRIALLSLVLASVSRAQSPQATTLNGWSAPVELPEMPSGRLHRWPTMAAVRDTIFLAANLYPIDGGALGPRPVYLARIPGGRIPAPAGDFQFVYPKVAAGRNGDVHLMWAEPDPPQPDAIDWDDREKMTLWHSTWARGKWSPAKPVFRADMMQWREDVGSVAVDDAGVAHAILWASGAKVTSLVHLMGTSAGWRSRHTPYSPLMPRPAIHASGDSIVIAFADDSVIVAASADAGKTWTSAIARRLGDRVATGLDFIRSDGRLYLVWAEGPTRKFGRDTLRVMRVDDVRRPVRVADVPLPRGASTVAAAAACGGLAFLVETFSQEPRIYAGTVAATGEVTQHLLRPPSELTVFSGIGATTRTVVAVLSMPGRTPADPGRAVFMSRPAC